VHVFSPSMTLKIFQSDVPELQMQKLVHVFSPSITLKIFQSDVPELQLHLLEMVVETMECLESFALKCKL